MAAYHSPDGLHWTPQEQRILETPGQGEDDGVMGGHADVVVSGDRAYLFYFTYPGRQNPHATHDTYAQRRSSIQVVELHERYGTLEADRDQPTFMALKPPEGA